MNVSIFPAAWDTTPTAEESLASVLEKIKGGHWKKQVEKYRNTCRAKGKDSEEAKRMKRAMPAFTVSGTFAERKDDQLINHSGFVAIDIDNLEDLKPYLRSIQIDPYVYSCFASVSGNGLCLIVKVDPEEHYSFREELFTDFRDYFQQRHNISIDKLADISRLRFISYDPDLYLFEKSRAFTIGCEHESPPAVTDGEILRVREWTDDEKLDFAVRKVATERGEFLEGDRHKYIFSLANFANRLGVPRSVLEAFCNASYPHWRENPSNAIKWVYKNRSAQYGILGEKDYGLRKEKQPPSEEEKEIKLISILKERRAEWDHPIPEPPAVISIQDGTISTAGNITVITGPSKSGKSGVMSGIMAGFMASEFVPVDTLGLDVVRNAAGFACVYIDTEQSRYNFDRNYRSTVRRAQLQKAPPWFEAYWLRGMMPDELLESTQMIAEYCKEKHGGICAFIIDGIGDYVMSVNDDVESNRIVEEFAILGEAHKCPVVTVLHFNPGTTKERGHIGSQLQRKAESILSVKKDPETEVSTISYKELRNAGRLQDIQFEWSDASKMHVGIGVKPKELTPEQKKTVKLRDLAEKCIRGSIDKADLAQIIAHEENCTSSTAYRKIQDMIGRQIIGAADLKKGPYFVITQDDVPF